MNEQNLNTENIINEDSESRQVELLVMRLQRTRKKGYKNPDNSVYVGRPTKWGNRYRALGDIVYFLNPNNDKWCFIKNFPTEKEAIEYAVEKYERTLSKKIIKEAKAELKGKYLLCWCKPTVKCHADILLKVANA